jgi:hypothetical protein
LWSATPAESRGSLPDVIPEDFLNANAAFVPVPDNRRCRRPDDRHDDGFVVELIRTGALFGDLSLERWLDRVERREERA